MIVKVGFEDSKESNFFLRALWSNFATKFGKCAWQYTPYKDGRKQIIFLGNMDIDLKNCFSVYVHYKKKAVVDKLEFLDTSDKEIANEINKKFQEIIKETISNFKKPDTKYLNTTIKSYYSISNYYSDIFKIEPYNDGLSSLTFSVKSYGENDAEFVAQSKLTRILDLFSVLTNAPFNYSKRDENSEVGEGDEVYYEDNDFIDGYPVESNKYILTKYGKKIIERVIAWDNDIEDDNLKKLLNACMHFHAARKFDAQIYDLYIYHGPEQTEEEGVYKINLSPRDQHLFDAREVNANIQEIATILYISALEVLSTIVFSNEAERCKTCSQLIYSISAKVKDLLYKYFPDHLAKQIHTYYSSRSKFLHEGRLLTSTYTGISIPQLDYNDPSGCKVVNKIPLLNLREYTGYCIRSVIKEYMVE